MHGEVSELACRLRIWFLAYLRFVLWCLNCRHGLHHLQHLYSLEAFFHLEGLYIELLSTRGLVLVMFLGTDQQ